MLMILGISLFCDKKFQLEALDNAGTVIHVQKQGLEDFLPSA